MLRLRTLSLRVVHKHTAASSSTSPASTGQHSFAAGSPSPMCTSPPRRSTHAPSLRASIGQVSAGGGGGGQGLTAGTKPEILLVRGRKIYGVVDL